MGHFSSSIQHESAEIWEISEQAKLLYFKVFYP